MTGPTESKAFKMKRFQRSTLIFLITGALATVAACDRRGPGGDGQSLATAGDLHLTVEDASEMLAATQELPNSPDVVSALGELWTDYALLATALVRDPTLGELDLSPLLQQQVDQELVHQLREEVIDVDVEVTEEELRQAFENEGQGEEIRARHILLGSTGGEPDEEVRGRAESLLERIDAGESFEELAREYSEDPGSAEEGGDLGYFGRGVMVPAFEEAAFALEPGQVSAVVQSPFGFHIIRLDDRRTPTFEDRREELLQELRMEHEIQAESIYVAEMEESARVEVEEGAVEAVRAVADDPTARLSRSEARRALAAFEGGEFTAEAFQEFLTGQPQGILDQIRNAPNEQVEGMIRNLTRVELLKREAERRGITLSSQEEEALRDELVENYLETARMLGLDDIRVEDGEDEREVVQARVRALMEEVLRGERNVIPMAELGIPLRRQFGAAFDSDAAEQVVERIAEIRGQEPVPDTPAAPPQEMVPPADAPTSDDPPMPEGAPTPEPEPEEREDR